MFYVYVLRSLKNNRLYIGSTKDLTKRLIEHNSGKNKATKYLRPFKLLYFEKYSTRVEAVRREKFLKSGQGRRWLNIQISNNRGVAQLD